MRRIVLSFLLVLLSSICFAQKLSIVELQNGSIIRGVLLESTEGTVKIQTADKSIFVYQNSDVIRITETTEYSNQGLNLPKRERSVIVSGIYAMNLLGFNVPNYGEINLGYYLDRNMSNTPVFFEIGVSAAYSYHNNGAYALHSPFIGIPLGIGFHSFLPNEMRINPFFRITPCLCLYKSDEVSSIDFGGVAPEVGATLNITDHILLTSSIAMMWDVNWASYSRCGQIGLYLGAGYRF